MEFEAMMRMLDNAVSFLDITIRYIIHILLYIVVYIINSERKIYSYYFTLIRIIVNNSCYLTGNLVSRKK